MPATVARWGQELPGGDELTMMVPLPVVPESLWPSLGVAVGLTPPLSVGVGEPDGLPLPLSVGVGEPDGLPLPVSVGVAVGVGEPAEVVGVGVTDGLGVAHDGVGVADGVGVDARLCTSSAAFSPAPLPIVVVVEADVCSVLVVTAALTAAAQVADVVGLAEAPPLAGAVPAPRDCWPPPDGVDSAADEPVPLAAWEPSPSVPAVPFCGAVPPLRTVLLAWMIAWRKGCTPNETLAMTAIAASTLTGRSQSTPTLLTLPAGRAGPPLSRSPAQGRRRSRGSGGHGSRATQDIASRTAAGAASELGQAQGPRHTQCLTVPMTSTPTASSHGRGGRPPILARIRSSPSAAGVI
jgi:hypothetical protein